MTSRGSTPTAWSRRPRTTRFTAMMAEAAQQADADGVRRHAVARDPGRRRGAVPLLESGLQLRRALAGARRRARELSDRALRLLTALVALAGVVLAGYLTSAHYADGSLVCPVGRRLRDGAGVRVRGDRRGARGGARARRLRRPARARRPGTRRGTRLAAAAIAFVGFMFSAYLLVIQAFVLDAFCVWCLVNDLVIAPALAVLT